MCSSSRPWLEGPTRGQTHGADTRCRSGEQAGAGRSQPKAAGSPSPPVHSVHAHSGHQAGLTDGTQGPASQALRALATRAQGHLQWPQCWGPWGGPPGRKPQQKATPSNPRPRPRLARQGLHRARRPGPCRLPPTLAPGCCPLWSPSGWDSAPSEEPRVSTGWRRSQCRPRSALHTAGTAPNPCACGVPISPLGRPPEAGAPALCLHLHQMLGDDS